MTTRGTQNIGWDVENRPVTDGGAAFIYDGDGNRVEKTEGGQTTLYINQYYEKVIAGTDVGKETLSYYLGCTLIAQRTILSGTSTTTYIHQDSLGSTSVVSNSTGASISTMTYTPFGLAVSPRTLWVQRKNSPASGLTEQGFTTTVPGIMMLPLGGLSVRIQWVSNKAILKL